ncbi:MAG: hypothetical protein ABWZ82_05005 [Candidatus Limnocylindrales bacterium]
MLGPLDYLYTPSADVASDVAWFGDVLGARVVFAIESSGTRVAMLELAAEQPRILLADHLEGERPILVYRAADLTATRSALEARGLVPERTLEIPFGPCCTYRSESGHRLAIYQRTRPEVEAHFAGRRDF